MTVALSEILSRYYIIYPLKDPKKLFNAGLEAKASRGIDFTENSKIDEAALKDLIREAVTLNSAKKK